VNKNFSVNEKATLQIKHSIAGRIGKIIEPLFRPIGMDGNKAIALIAGIAAKEVVLSTLCTIYSIGEVSTENIGSLREKIITDKNWTPLKSLTFLIFCLIYTPCIVSVAIFFKETGLNYKWLALLVLGDAIFAWIVSFVVFNFGNFLKVGM
jgi:ferrous iron transport protein B